MQCFICVAYLMIICSAHPPSDRAISKPYQRRSLFHDVIESIRIRSRIPENHNYNEDNSLEPNYENYGFHNDLLHLPSDSNFTPRRNDRIEMPPLKYRFPKSLQVNESNDEETPKEEIVLYVNTPSDITETKLSTLKPKKQKRPKPNTNNNKISNKNKDGDDTTEPIFEMEDRPITNTMSGQSQIGNRDSQTVVKPTVIVNFRGSVNHKESEIRLERRKNENDNVTKTVLPQNIFNINQEIKLEKMDEMGSTGGKTETSGKIKQKISFVPEQAEPRLDEDMLMCETSAIKDKNTRSSRNYDTLQILFSL